jgi:hypothetical protein
LPRTRTQQDRRPARRSELRLGDGQARVGVVIGNHGELQPPPHGNPSRPRQAASKQCQSGEFQPARHPNPTRSQAGEEVAARARRQPGAARRRGRQPWRVADSTTPELIKTAAGRQQTTPMWGIPARHAPELTKIAGRQGGRSSGSATTRRGSAKVVGNHGELRPGPYGNSSRSTLVGWERAAGGGPRAGGRGLADGLALQVAGARRAVLVLIRTIYEVKLVAVDYVSDLGVVAGARVWGALADLQQGLVVGAVGLGLPAARAEAATRGRIGR